MSAPSAEPTSGPGLKQRWLARGRDSIGRSQHKHLDAEYYSHYDAAMRTTLTIDDDLARELKALARCSGKSFKAVVNEVMRNGLTTGEKPLADREPFRVAAAPRGFLPGIDPLKLNQLVDELDVEAFVGQPHEEPPA